MAQRLRIDLPVCAIPKQRALNVPPRPPFFQAKIERNGVGEMNAIEGNLAAKETHDPGSCLDELDALRGLARSDIEGRRRGWLNATHAVGGVNARALRLRVLAPTGSHKRGDEENRGEQELGCH